MTDDTNTQHDPVLTAEEVRQHERAIEITQAHQANALKAKAEHKAIHGRLARHDNWSTPQ